MASYGHLHVKHDNKPTDFWIYPFTINPCLLLSSQPSDSTIAASVGSDLDGQFNTPKTFKDLRTGLIGFRGQIIPSRMVGRQGVSYQPNTMSKMIKYEDLTSASFQKDMNPTQRFSTPRIVRHTRMAHRILTKSLEII